jgi:WD40 repeat protein
MNIQQLVCQYDQCKLILENPIVLPCGFSLCKQHLENVNHKFNCFFCNDEHEKLTENGFLMSKTINSIIDEYFQVNPVMIEIKESFDKLNESIKEYEKIDPDVYIYDYFAEIRNKVDLHREELIKEINYISNEIIKQLKDKEEKCNSNKTKLEPVNFERIKKEELPFLWNKLRTPDINRDELNELLSIMKDQIKHVQNEIKKFKNYLLLNESIEFEKYEKSSLFGILIITKHNCSILSNSCGDLIKLFNEHSDSIKSIQVDETSNKIISASDDKTIKIWDLESGKCLKTLKDHKDWVKCILTISNNKFLSGSWDNTVKIWHLNSYKCLKTLKNESGIFSLCLIADNQVACGCLNGLINIWDLNRFNKVKSFTAHDDRIEHLKLADKSKLISCSSDKKIKIWNLDTFGCIKQLDGHSGWVNHLQLVPVGNLLSCSNDQTIILWKIITRNILKSIKFDQPVYCLKMLNDCDLLAIGVGDYEIGNIIIYDLAKMQTIKVLKAHLSYVACLHLLSNGNLLSGSRNGEIKLWKILE